MFFFHSASLVLVLLLTMITFCLQPSVAHAYLDLTTGSYVVQVVVASALGAVFAVKTYWNNIKFKLKAMFGKDVESQS